MSEYEISILKLKIVELALAQTQIALTAMLVNSVDANIVADASLEMLNEATEHVSKLDK